MAISEKIPNEQDDSGPSNPVEPDEDETQHELPESNL